MASAIHRAVLDNDFKAVRAIVDKDSLMVDFIAPVGGQKGVTPIQIAARHGQTEMAALLLGLNADLRGRSGVSSALTNGVCRPTLSAHPSHSG